MNDLLTAPRISVIMPARGDAASISRAVASVVSQSFRSWELLLVDVEVTAQSCSRLESWSRRDPRIRIVAAHDGAGVGAAQNAGIHRASGTMVTYIDCEDEYYHDYLEIVNGYHANTDVIICAYDRVMEQGGDVVGLWPAWSPNCVKGDVFQMGGDDAAPLGVAHRRELALRVGGFDENIWWNVHGDLWKRMARVGASFMYLRWKSGRRRVAPGGQMRPPRASTLQRDRAVANYREQRPLFHNAHTAAARRYPATKILFASFHSIVDFSNGAAVATLDVLRSLRASGFDCQAFCTPKLDFDRETDFEKIISDLGEPYEIRPSVCRAHRARVLYTRRQGVPITVIRLRSTRDFPGQLGECDVVLEFFQKFLDTFQPDVMLTYGVDPITHGMIGLAKRRDIPVIFAIHNFSFTDVRTFINSDYCYVPSEFARRFYWEKVGLGCHALPNPVDWDRVLCRERAPRFVTFINPSLEKGAYAFVSIAQELGRRRPDIPFLVVESRGTRDTLAACGLDLHACGNIQFMPNTNDPRRFWGITKIALMPSLWWENQPAVGYEAMINGIPVIGSDRGGIPETLGDAGLVLRLPEWMNPATTSSPSADEIGPWVDAIIRLWDDPTLYADRSSGALKEADRWHPDRLRPLYADFFRNACPQPGPPFLPRAEFDGKSIVLPTWVSAR